MEPTRRIDTTLDTEGAGGRGRRRVLRGLIVLGVAFALFAAWLLGTAWYSVPLYEPEDPITVLGTLMTAAEYGELIDTHERPYVYEIGLEAGQGRVLMFGSEHTKDPTDPQIGDIRARWNTFGPTVALVESDLGMMFPAFMDPVETFGEPGIVYSLARDDGIPVYSWEPPNDVLVESLIRQGFTASEVAMRVMLGPYFSNLRHGRPSDPEAFVEEFRKERAQWQGLEATFGSVAEIDAAWQSRFPDGPDWRDVSDEFGLPGFLGEMDPNQARDEHFANVVVALVAEGHRVFAIAGLSHAVKLEPVLIATFGEAK